MSKKVVIYSTPTCHFCHLAKDFFMEHNVEYTEFDVSVDLKKRKEMVEKTGQLGVPVIEVDGQVMVGFSEEALTQALGL